MFLPSDGRVVWDMSFLVWNEWSAVTLLLALLDITRPVVNMDLTSRQPDKTFNICHRLAKGSRQP